MSTPDPTATEVRQAVYAYLKADSGVVTAVSTRVYQRKVPAGATKPLIVIWPPQSNVPDYELAGAARRRTRLQITAMADTQADAEKAARAVIAALEGYSGTMYGIPIVLIEVIDDSQSDQDEIDEVHHHVILRVTHKG